MVLRDRELFVSNFNDAAVEVFNVDTLQHVRSIAVPHTCSGERPL